jgi:hypothetical protein
LYEIVQGFATASEPARAVNGDPSVFRDQLVSESRVARLAKLDESRCHVRIRSHGVIVIRNCDADIT